MSVRSYVRLLASDNSVPIERFFVELDIWIFFENLSRKFKFNQNLSRMTETLHKYQYTFLSYLVRFFLQQERFQTNFIEKIKTYISR
jgi:hypothetical protein